VSDILKNVLRVLPGSSLISHIFTRWRGFKWSTLKPFTNNWGQFQHIHPWDKPDAHSTNACNVQITSVWRPNLDNCSSVRVKLWSFISIIEIISGTEQAFVKRSPWPLGLVHLYQITFRLSFTRGKMFIISLRLV